MRTIPTLCTLIVALLFSALTAVAQQSYLVEDFDKTQDGKFLINQDQGQSVSVGGQFYYLGQDQFGYTSIRRSDGVVSNNITANGIVANFPKDLAPSFLKLQESSIIYRIPFGVFNMMKGLVSEASTNAVVDVLDNDIFIAEPNGGVLKRYSPSGELTTYRMSSFFGLSQLYRFGNYVVIRGKLQNGGSRMTLVNLTTRLVEELPLLMQGDEGPPLFLDNTLYYIGYDQQRIGTSGRIHSYNVVTRKMSDIGVVQTAIGSAASLKSVQRIDTNTYSFIIDVPKGPSLSIRVAGFTPMVTHRVEIPARIKDVYALPDGTRYLLTYNAKADTSEILHLAPGALSAPTLLIDNLLPQESFKFLGTISYHIKKTDDGFALVSVTPGANPPVNVYPSFVAQEVYGFQPFTTKILVSMWRGGNRATLGYLDPSQGALTILHQLSGKNAGSSPHDLVSFNNQLHFLATTTLNDRITAPALMRSGGIPGDAAIVKQFGRSDALSGLTVHQGIMYFARRALTTGEIWKSDGTHAGTTLIATLPGLFEEVVSRRVVGSILYLVVKRESKNYELFALNLVSGAVESLSVGEVITLVEQSGSNHVYFTRTSAVDGKSDLFITEGTSTTTKEIVLSGDILDVLPSTPGGVFVSSALPAGVTPQVTLSLKDGTAPSLDRTIVSGLPAGTRFATAGNTLYSISGRVLSVINSASGQATVIAEAPEGEAFDATNTMHDGERGYAYFVSTVLSGTRSQLWRTDGTQPGTLKLAQFEKIPTLSGSITFKGKRLFAAYTPEYGEELWKSDGTVEGTSIYDDIADRAEDGSPREFTIVGEHLFFVARDPQIGFELWALDRCESDPSKYIPGLCGCGSSDSDDDRDGAPLCQDICPADPAKTARGVCGCGVADVDTNANGIIDCNESPIASASLAVDAPTVKKTKNGWKVTMSVGAPTGVLPEYTMTLKRIGKNRAGKKATVETIKKSSLKSSHTIKKLTKGSWSASFKAVHGATVWQSKARSFKVR
jgi:ELWxxDGT repeat protein